MGKGLVGFHEQPAPAERNREVRRVALTAVADPELDKTTVGDPDTRKKVEKDAILAVLRVDAAFRTIQGRLRVGPHRKLRICLQEGLTSREATVDADLAKLVEPDHRLVGKHRVETRPVAARDRCPDAHGQ
jgi:hypothetical protein